MICCDLDSLAAISDDIQKLVSAFQEWCLGHLPAMRRSHRHRLAYVRQLRDCLGLPINNRIASDTATPADQQNVLNVCLQLCC